MSQKLALADTNVGNSLKELHALELETEALLKAIRSKTSNKKKVIGQIKGDKQVSNSKPKKSTVAKSTNQLKRSQTAVSLSLDATLDKTKNLFEDTRVTVEIFDDASPDVTPRQGFDAKSKRLQNIATEIESLKAADKAESYFRKTPFNDEKTRVSNRKDTFVPAPGISADDVSKERERLHQLEESARLKIFQTEMELAGQKTYLEKDRAVLKVQSLFRGHIGRQKFTLIKRLKELSDDVSGGWIEVRDRQSGDTWYYNKQTGVSQWDRPDEMRSTLNSDSSLKKLPIIPTLTATSSSVGPPKLLAGDKLTVTMSLPSLDATTLSKNAAYAALGATNLSAPPGTIAAPGTMTRNQEVEANKEVDELLGFTKFNPVESLSAPDGTFKPQLRATVMDALLETRFDTVSTVLSDDRWMEADNNIFALADDKTKKAVIVPSAYETRVDKSRKPLVAVMAVNKKGKKAIGPIVVDPNADRDEWGNKKILNPASLTVNDVEHPGFESGILETNDSMCFGCWSAGLGRSCVIHEDPNGPKRLKSQTMLLCRNWELSIMRRRYRAEEIQEVFLKNSTSLQYDVKHRVFSTVVEMKHQIYREVRTLQRKLNDVFFLFLKIRRWMFTFAEQVLLGKVKSQVALKQAALMRTRRSQMHQAQTLRYCLETKHRLPIGPTTGYSWPERINTEQYLYKHPDPALGHEVELILAYPTPVPQHLYVLQECHLSTPKSIPMPKPEYSTDAKKTFPSNQFIDDTGSAAWIERLCKSITVDVLTSSSSQIKAISPAPGLEKLRRSKQPTPCSIKFATLGSKPVPGNLDIIALPKELLISQLISTYFPPQYGNFMVMEKTTVSPGVSPEGCITFETLLMPPGKQVYILRPVEHPLNYRRAPTISVNTRVQPDDKHYYGINRPDQTGEQESHGFRTTTWSVGVFTATATDPFTFTPSSEIATLNNTSANKSVSTHADLKYPFCQPSTRDNSTLDFFHLLLTGHLSVSKAQVFTATSVQEPGLFMKGMRDDLPMGHLMVSVYRSWAFTQRDTIAEYKTDDGVSYWYHRRTGQTFWERPLYSEEEASPLNGGTVLDMYHPEEPTCTHKGHEGAERRYSQGDFRKLMLAHKETEAEATKRRKDAGKSAQYARMRGILPETPHGSVNSLAGSQLDDDQLEEMLNAGPATLKHRPLSATTERSGLTDAESVGTHISSESSLVNDQGVRRSMNSPLKQQQLQQLQQLNQPSHSSLGLGSLAANDDRTTATRFDYQMGSVLGVGSGGGSVQHSSTHMQGQPQHGMGSAFGGSMASFGAAAPAVGGPGFVTGPRPGGAVSFGDSLVGPSGNGSAGGASMSGMDANMVNALTQSLSQMMSSLMTDNANPQDMLQLGMGMGMALLSSGAVMGVVQNKAEKSTSELFRQPDGSMLGAVGSTSVGGPYDGSLSHDGNMFPHLTEEQFSVAQSMQASKLASSTVTRISSSEPHRPKGSDEPIGVPNTTIVFAANKNLDQAEAQRQEREHRDLLSEPLTAVDAAKEVKVQQPTLTPDEAPIKELTITLPANAEMAVQGKVPLLAYPELSNISNRGAPDGATLHPAAGVGTSFLPKNQAEGKEMVEGSGGALRKSVMPLPVGFFESIIARHVAGQEADYLPQVPNLPQARTVGRVKPRSAALDWLAVSFDPWSAGKPPLNTEYLSSLNANAEKFFPGGAAIAGDSVDALRKATVADAYVNVDDDEGMAEQRAEVSRAQVMAQDFKKVASLCRHSKFGDVEQLINQTDWTVPIDYQDDRGNSLLHVVAQNGNRRLVKLSLRRGATINMQNLNGQTALHFAFGYGYADVGNYLIKKGADDNIRNKDGLTCYEGLIERELALL